MSGLDELAQGPVGGVLAALMAAVWLVVLLRRRR